MDLFDTLRSLGGFIQAKIRLKGWTADRRTKNNDSFQ
jgi:hypothetical protein